MKYGQKCYRKDPFKYQNFQFRLDKILQQLTKVGKFILWFSIG